MNKYISNVCHNDLKSVLDLRFLKEEVARVEKALGSSGRLVLRKSGTEPLIRVMIEAIDPDIGVSLANSLAETIRTN